jgi:hypothetical protein
LKAEHGAIHIQTRFLHVVVNIPRIAAFPTWRRGKIIYVFEGEKSLLGILII